MREIKPYKKLECPVRRIQVTPVTRKKEYKCFVVETDSCAGICTAQYLDKNFKAFPFEFSIKGFSTYHDAEQYIFSNYAELEEMWTLTLNKLYTIDCKGEYSALLTDETLLISRRECFGEIASKMVKQTEGEIHLYTRKDFFEIQECVKEAILYKCGEGCTEVPFNLPVDQFIHIKDIKPLLSETE